MDCYASSPPINATQRFFWHDSRSKRRRPLSSITSAARPSACLRVCLSTCPQLLFLVLKGLCLSPACICQPGTSPRCRRQQLTSLSEPPLLPASDTSHACLQQLVLLVWMQTDSRGLSIRSSRGYRQLCPFVHVTGSCHVIAATVCVYQSSADHRRCCCCWFVGQMSGRKSNFCPKKPPQSQFIIHKSASWSFIMSY